jgi:hypothetical protein
MKNINEEMVSIDNTGKCMSFEKGKNEAYADSKKAYKLTKVEALAMLPDKKSIHTFRNSDIALIGADWTRKEIIEMMDIYDFELTGEQATSMGHGMAFKDELGWLFIETK